LSRLSEWTVAGDAGETRGTRAIGIVNFALVSLVATVLGVKLYLVTLLNVNWDEFYYLGQIHQYLNGELSARFQVFHVHLFWWLPLVSESEVSQIIAGRLVMYVLGVGSAGFTYLIARQFLNVTGALFAVLAYLSISNIIEHGTSFRVDPIGTFLFLAAVSLLLYRPDRWYAAIAAGLIMGLATMITIKAAIHLVAIGAIVAAMLALAERRREIWIWAAAFVSAFVAGASVLYGWHQLTLPAQESVDAAGFAYKTADKVLASGFLPRWRELAVHVVRNPLVWGLMISGLALLLVEAIRRRQGAFRRLLICGAFLTPLLSVLVYRNAFPYFYVFIMSPAVVVGAILVDRLARMVSENGSRMAVAEIVVFVGLVSATLAFHVRSNVTDATVAQRQVVEVVHKMFPGPVPYIDGMSMIASFPTVGFFMSTWGMEIYRGENRPVFEAAIAEEAPIFVLANKPALTDAMSGMRQVPQQYALLEADREALIDNYVHHWGIIYVAGKNLRFDAPAPVLFEIRIPGTYTVEAAGRATIDGMTYAPGQPIHLAVGRHVLVPDGSAGIVTLRWGEGLFRPTEPPSAEPFFVPFR
jgi:hypothetical protein